MLHSRLIYLRGPSCMISISLAEASLSFNKTPQVVSVGCIGVYKGNVVLCECGKMREMGKMCHVMSIDEKVRCIWL